MKFLSTEVTQKIFEETLHINPSIIKGENLPVTNISWYDALYFCNKLSIIDQFEPVYSVNNEINPDKWDYKICSGEKLNGSISQFSDANGYRLPSKSEWEYAAKGGEVFFYPGSNNPDEIAWFLDNSDNKLHECGLKKANKFKLYDMSGNVWEWCWDESKLKENFHIVKGGCYAYYNHACKIDYTNDFNASSQIKTIGFRIIQKY